MYLFQLLRLPPVQSHGQGVDLLAAMPELRGFSAL